jgi:hypothetical protein
VPLTTSQIFDFLDRHSSFAIDRRELYSATFSRLRRSIRLIVTRLTEADEPESEEVADTLRMRMSEWLTVPVSFDDSLLESVLALGEPDAVATRWGQDVRAAYDTACDAGRALQNMENPLRTQLRDAITRLNARQVSWKVYCHRRAKIHFETVFADAPLLSEAFLHSVRDYREAEPFEVLIKVGPLRSRGWGAAPDALLTAPRFGTLLQFVWSGSADEEDFGYDPAAQQAAPLLTTSSARSHTQSATSTQHITWTRNVIQAGDPRLDQTLQPDVDDLRLFHEQRRGSEMRRALLLQLDDEDGVLYPPHSEVATFDPEATDAEAIGYRSPGDTLAQGMFVILPLLGTADLGALHAGEGHYSGIWKERLRQEFRGAASDLAHRLRSGGIELRNLRSCVRQWCRPPSTVIHAPQQRRHFEILIRVLGIDHDAPQTSDRARRPWWQYAWAEIGQTRGEAIQTGMQEQEIIDEQLFEILNDLLPEIRREAPLHNVFAIEIPAGRSLRGAARFYRVRSIEDGFLVPETLLKVVCDLDTVEQWRA